MKKQLMYFNLGVVVFQVLLFVGFIGTTVTGNLENDALIVSIFLLVFCCFCGVGLCQLLSTSVPTTKRRSLYMIICSSALIEFMFLILSFVEWLDPDCETDVLAVCSAQKENFLAAVAVATLIHFGFAVFWIKLYMFWKSQFQRPVEIISTSPETGEYPSDAPFFEDRSSTWAQSSSGNEM